MQTDTGPAEAGPVSLHAEVRGSGRPLVLVTGLGYATWAWRRQLPALAETRRVIAVDNRGAGRSPKPPGPYSIAMLADDTAAAMRSLDAVPADVVGLSMGGYVALTLALRRPELVRSLVLAGTSAGGPGAVPVPPSTLEVWLAHAGRPPAEYARATWWLSFAPGWPEAHPDEYEELLAARLEFPTPPEAWRAQYEACERYLADGVPVEDVAVPTLVLHGDADRVVPVENGRALAARLPRGRLVELSGRGHLLPIEAADEFNALLLAWLEGVDGS